MLQQLAADTGATDIWINEERLHVCPVNQHEAAGLVILINSNSHRCMGQKATHFGINGLSVLGTEKVMGGVHGAPPKVDKGGAVLRT